MAQLYGVVVADHAEPYVTGYNMRDMWYLVLANRHTDSGRDARLVVDVEECDYCDEDLPGGWVEVDENGDYIDPPLHDSCRRPYWEERYADV